MLRGAAASARKVLPLFPELEALCHAQSSVVSCEDEGGSTGAARWETPGRHLSSPLARTLPGTQVYKRKHKLEKFLKICVKMKLPSTSGEGNFSVWMIPFFSEPAHCHPEYNIRTEDHPRAFLTHPTNPQLLLLLDLCTTLPEQKGRGFDTRSLYI